MKPRLFVASSVEGLDIAYAIQENLDEDAEVTVWDQGIFDLSKITLNSLIDALNNFDFAAFVFSPDDVVKIRGEEKSCVRDNIVFELGLFIGKIGQERSFLIIPRDVKDLHLPTDLLGLTPATFNPKRQDNNLKAALGPACNQIRRAMQAHGVIQPQPKELLLENSGETEEYDENDIISILESWMDSRTNDENTSVIKYSDVDKELDFKSGTAKKYIKEAAKKWDYIVVREGNVSISFRYLSSIESGTNPITGY